MFNVVGEASSGQLAFVLSVVLCHHDEGEPKILENGRGIYIGPPDVF